MSRYTLKPGQNQFQVLAKSRFLRRVYKPGKKYKREEIPDNELHRFEATIPDKTPGLGPDIKPIRDAGEVLDIPKQKGGDR